MSNQDKQSNQLLTIYFDGLCKICAAEINHYRKQPGAEKFRFVDITSASFNAVTEKVDPVQVHKVMHVRTADGVLKLKTDAFIEIWKNLPRYKKWVKFAEAKPVKFFMDMGYEIFTLARPYLPRDKQSCEDSPYCEMPPKNVKEKKK